MVRNRVWLTSTEAGELAPEFAIRTDAPIRNKGLLKARNIRLLSGGGWQRRWGTERKVSHVGKCRYEGIGLGGEASLLFAFSNGRLDIYNSDWVLQQSITSGCPWTTSNIDTMTVAAEANLVSISSHNFFPVEITRSGSTWSIAQIAFSEGRSNSTKQPYYRFHKLGVTLKPSALTGSITLESSEAHFNASHVGTIIRYQGEEILITGYSDTTHVTGTVVGALYPTINVPITDSSGFSVGDIVEGETTKVQGVVISVPTSASVVVLLKNGYQYFDGTTPENLIGPNQRSKLTAACTNTTPAASVDWDEQLISSLRGYPNSVSYHRGRRLYADFPNAPNLLCASVPGDPSDFDVGEAGNGDAIIQTIGRDDTLRLRFTASMEQLLLFTDAGIYYVPETVGAPFSPTNAEFLSIGPEVCGDTSPIKVAEGVLFCEQRSGRLLICIPTGNVRRSWDISDLSELSYHLMENPKKIIALPATFNNDREVLVLLQNGDIACMKYGRGKDAAGWTLWDTEGTWDSLAVVDGRAFISATRDVGGLVYWGEELTPNVNIDGASFSSSRTWGHLPNKQIVISKNRQFLKQATLNGSGATTAIESTWGSVAAGFSYDVLVKYPSPIDGENGQFRVMAICFSKIDVVDSGDFVVDDQLISTRKGNEAEDELPALKSDTYTSYCIGWDYDPSVTIEQKIPNPLTIRAVTQEVKS